MAATQVILDASLVSLCDRMRVLPRDLVPWDFIHTLDPDPKTVALRFCLLVWERTLHMEIPRQNQLEVALAIYARKGDVLAIAGTGSGKTLMMVLLLLMERVFSIAVTISPLQRLQITQVLVFYGVPVLDLLIDVITGTSLQ